MVKRTDKREINLIHSSPRDFNLNESSVGCAPCLGKALKIDRQFKEINLNEIRINKIKSIVRSIFEDKNNDKKN